MRVNGLTMAQRKDATVRREDLDKKYPLGYLIDPETGIVVPAIGGGRPEGDEGDGDGDGNPAAEGDAGDPGSATGSGDEGDAEGDPTEFLTADEKNLLGGKNFKTKADMIKALVHGNAHIERLETERKEDRGALQQVQARLDALDKGQPTPAAPSESVSPESFESDPQYVALWNANKYEEAADYKARKIAASIVQAEMKKSRAETQTQTSDVANRQRVMEARQAIDKMMGDAEKFPGFKEALPYMQRYIDEKTKLEANWQNGFATVDEMFIAAYADTSFRYPNLINPGRGAAASAVGGGSGAGSRGKPGEGGKPKSKRPKTDPKVWAALGLAHNPWQDEVSALDQKASDELAAELETEAAGMPST